MNMDGEQIGRLLRTAKGFDGVFSPDTLPADPRLLVCNLDPSHREGTHWICIYVDGETGTGEYFDSLGRPPIESLERYMNAVCSCRWCYNDRQLQSILSAFCGHYCVYFCMLRSRGVSMNNIVASFSNDTAFNDYYVDSFECRNLKK